MLTSNANNIRYNGTGRAYVNDVGVAGPGYDLGEMETLNFGVSVSTEKLKSTRNASRGVIIEKESERDASLTFGLREQSEDNLKMALLGSAINTDNQIAAAVFQTTKTWASDLYIDLGHVNVFVTKVSGVITGSLAVGDTLTGAGSSETGKIAYLGADYAILVDVTGTFTVGERLNKTVDTNYLTVSGVETLEDVCITSSDGATLRVNGTDYTIDPDYGYIRKLSTGALVNTDKVSYDREAVSRKYLYGLSSGSVTKKFTFVSDKDDSGPRQRWIFHKVQINLNGEFPLLGEGAGILQCTGTVLYDATQPSGQEYFKLEMM